MAVNITYTYAVQLRGDTKQAVPRQALVQARSARINRRGDLLFLDRTGRNAAVLAAFPAALWLSVELNEVFDPRAGKVQAATRLSSLGTLFCEQCQAYHPASAPHVAPEKT